MRLRVTRIGLFLSLFSFATLTHQAYAEVTVNLGLASNYTREGISQTRGKLSASAGLTWLHNSGFYLGAWAANLDRRNDHAYLEGAGFVGYYLPFNENIALDLTATRYAFFGDKKAWYQDYNELGASLLLNDSWKFGYRVSENYLDKDHSWHALDGSYTLHTDSFDFEFFVARYLWQDADGLDGASYNYDKLGDRSNYWHFRIGAERTWNKWDYRLTVERTNLSHRFDGGTIIQFGMQRYFNLF